MTQPACNKCHRGPEACEWCHDLDERDWETICDCGLEFGSHMLDCTGREDRRWVVAQSYESSQEPRA